MSVLIVGVVVNILRHIRVEHGESCSVCCVAGATRNFAIWKASQLAVLHPEISLQNLSCRREPKQSCIPSGYTTAFVMFILRFDG